MRSIKEYIPGLKGASPLSFDGIRIADLGDLLDENGNEIIELDAVASAVNNIRVLNAVTTGSPQVKAVGDDTNIGLLLDGKGSGAVHIASESTGGFKTGTLAEAAAIKGIYYSGNVSVTVPSITDPDIARVQVDVSAAFTMQPAVGDAVIAIPTAALPTNCRLQGAFVQATDTIEIVYGSEGGNVTGAGTNHKFLIIDMT